MDSIQQLWFTCRTYENGNHVECLRPGRQWTGSLTSADKHSFYDLGHHRCQWNGAIASDLSPDLYSEIMFASFHADGTPSRWRDNWSVMVLAQTAKTTVWISYQNRYDFTVYTGHTKNGMKIIPKTVWSSYHKIVWFSSINWCDRYSGYSSIIHAWYTFSLFLLLNDINVAKQITRHIKEMHWHKKQ